jgi:hypothetical protein
MNSKIFWQLNEAYQLGVCNQKVVEEETLSEEELVNIEEWVEALIEEGYDLDQFSDEELYEAYLSALDEATAMAKRGLDEPAIRRQITSRTGGGEAADRATALENRPTYGDTSRGAQRSRLARAQRGSFRSTTSSSPGLHGYAHKSNDPAVNDKQAARGAQRGVLTPNEKKQLNREELDLYDIVSEYLVSEGFCDFYEDADVIMVNMSEEWRESIMEEVLDEANRPEREMIKKGLLKPGRQVARIRNLNRQSGNTNWYAADPRDTRAIKSPGKGGVFNSKQRREQEADAFNTSRRRMEHEFDQDSSRARKTGDWNKVDKKRPFGGHKTRFEKERDERNNR